MKKTEMIYRKILSEAIENKQQEFTQLALSKELKISLSTVNNALKPLDKIGCINIKKRSFSIRDLEKTLIFWATKRNLEKDILYRTNVDAPIAYIEKNLPAEITYTAYSGYKFKFDDVPADYSEIIIYSDNIEEIKKRFPLKKGHPNLIVLKKDKGLISKNNIVPIPQIYVDLWNLGDWYAKEFLKSLEQRILVK